MKHKQPRKARGIHALNTERRRAEQRVRSSQHLKRLKEQQLLETISKQAELTEINRPGVYLFLWSNDPVHVKIGHTNNLQARLNSYRTGSPHEIILLAAIETINKDEAGRLEVRLHEQFTQQRVRGEWFKLNDRLIDLVWSSQYGGTMFRQWQHWAGRHDPKELDRELVEEFKVKRIERHKSKRERKAEKWLAKHGSKV